jgi:hypothetical protein
MNTLRTVTALLVLAVSLLLVAVFMVGCPGDYDSPPVSADTSTTNTPWPAQEDGYPPAYPDQAGPQWDTSSGSADTGYPGAPFGCRQDSDCFGLRCCATPWGVKLCKEVCATTD